MNSKSSSRLQLSEYSLYRSCMYFKRLNVVLAESDDAKGDVRSAFQCCKYK